MNYYTEYLHRIDWRSSAAPRASPVRRFRAACQWRRQGWMVDRSGLGWKVSSMSPAARVRRFRRGCDSDRQGSIGSVPPPPRSIGHVTSEKGFRNGGRRRIWPTATYSNGLAEDKYVPNFEYRCYEVRSFLWPDFCDFCDLLSIIKLHPVGEWGNAPPPPEPWTIFEGNVDIGTTCISYFFASIWNWYKKVWNWQFPHVGKNHAPSLWHLARKLRQSDVIPRPFRPKIREPLAPFLNSDKF